jgi:transposase
MPALVATCFNPDMKAEYNQLTNAGKPAKVALTAVMRKQIVPAKRSPEAQQTLDPKARLIKKDTLACTVAAA